MKKIILAFILSLSACIGYAQTPAFSTQDNYTNYYRFHSYLGVDSGFLLPQRDTLWSPSRPAIVFRSQDSSIYLFNGQKWWKIGQSSSTPTGVYLLASNFIDSLNNNRQTISRSGDSLYLTFGGSVSMAPDSTLYATRYWVSTQGFLTTEVEPKFTGSAAATISTANINSWNNAFVNGSYNAATDTLKFTTAAGGVTPIYIPLVQPSLDTIYAKIATTYQKYQVDSIARGKLDTGNYASGANTVSVAAGSSAISVTGGTQPISTNPTFIITPNNTIPLWNAVQLQGLPILNTAPSAGQVLFFNGTSWAPYSLNPGSGTVTSVGLNAGYGTVVTSNTTNPVTSVGTFTVRNDTSTFAPNDNKASQYRMWGTVGINTQGYLTLKDTAHYALQIGDSALGKGMILPIGDTATLPPTKGGFVYDLSDSSIYYSDGNKWMKNDVNIDTVSTISQLEAYNRSSNVNLVYVTDSLRGGLFSYSSNNYNIDDGTIFQSTSRGGRWIRNFNKGTIYASWYGLINNDTSAQADLIQNALTHLRTNGGGTLIFNPGHYSIDSTLLIGSNTNIIATGATFFLKDSSNSEFLKNYNASPNGSGINYIVDSNISISGGTWNYNGINQRRISPYTGKVSMDFVFQGVNNINLKNANIVNATSYHVLFTTCNNININNLVVMDSANNSFFNENQDGIHFDGLINNVYINDVRLRTTDDAIAFTAMSVSAEPYFYGGNINNVNVNNLYLDNSLKGIRLLAAGVDSIKNVRINGISGISTGDILDIGSYIPSFGSGAFGQISISGINVKVDQSISGMHGYSPINIYSKTTNLIFNDVQINGNWYSYPVFLFNNRLYPNVGDTAISLILNNININYTGAFNDSTIAFNFPINSSINNATFSNINLENIGTAINIGNSKFNTITLSNNIGTLDTSLLINNSIIDSLFINGSYFLGNDSLALYNKGSVVNKLLNPISVFNDVTNTSYSSKFYYSYNGTIKMLNPNYLTSDVKNNVFIQPNTTVPNANDILTTGIVESQYNAPNNPPVVGTYLLINGFIDTTAGFQTGFPLSATNSYDNYFYREKVASIWGPWYKAASQSWVNSQNYAPSTGGTGYIHNQFSSPQASSNYWIDGNGRINGNLGVGGDSLTIWPKTYTMTSPTIQSFQTRLNSSMNLTALDSVTAPVSGLDMYTNSLSLELDNTASIQASGAVNMITGVRGALGLNMSGTTTKLWSANANIAGIVGTISIFNNANYQNISAIAAASPFSYTQGTYTKFTGIIDTSSQLYLQANPSPTYNVDANISNPYGIYQASDYPNRFSGGIQMPIRVVTGSTTVTTSDYTVVSASGTNTFTIPAASTCGRQVFHFICNTGTVTLSVGYLNYSGTNTTTIAAGSGVTIQSNGTSYYQIGQ